jgi:hypothetical protein
MSNLGYFRFQSISSGQHARGLHQRTLATLLAMVGVFELALPLRSAAVGFPAVVQLSSLDGSNGFRIDGKSMNDALGTSVAGAGDVNGDGYDDLIIGAPFAGFNSNGAGSAYVVLGHGGAFSHPLALTSLVGSNGFHIPGIASGDQFGFSVSSAGDINDDGYADMFIGAWGSDASNADAGSGYLLFGKNGGFNATEFLLLNGNNGFGINGVAVSDGTGFSVAAGGDHNGDGFDDLIIGAPYADPSGISSGKSYVVFGKSGGFSSVLALSGMVGGTAGYGLAGETAGGFSGRSVSSAGDVNGDGYADVIIGADHDDPLTGYNGSSYVVFGKSGVFTTTLALSSLDGGNGFRLDSPAEYDMSGASVDSAGDINGDGYADLIIGAPGATPAGFNSGSSYVVFGHPGSFLHPFELFALNGVNGFRLDGEQAAAKSGIAVSGAGDINGDGVDDLLVGASLADTPIPNAGRTYVVFGRSGGGFPHPLSLASLNGSNGFRLDGIDAGDFSGRSVSAAGDINGDGVADLVIGAPGAGANGQQDSGSAYVVFGRNTDRLFAHGFES